MTIRRGTPDDVPRAIEIWRKAVDATHGFLTPEDRAERHDRRRAISA